MNFSDLQQLRTEQFLDRYKQHNHQSISIPKLRKLIHKHHISYPFSTIPYHIYHLDSKKSSRKMHSGNCISLSMLMVDQLKRDGIDSHLIPASVPKEYNVDGLLPLSHVAVCIPITDRQILVLDMAFYFLEPLFIDLDQFNLDYIRPITSASVYTNRRRNVNVKYQGKIQNTTQHSTQILKENTNMVTCYYDDTDWDEWSYYITEVLNPDENIGQRFLDVKQDPFISIIDKDYKMKLYMKYNNWNPEMKAPQSIHCKYKGQEYIFYDEKSIPSRVKRGIKNVMRRYLL